MLWLLISAASANLVYRTADTASPSTVDTNFSDNDIEFRATDCGPWFIEGWLSSQRLDGVSVELAFEVLVDSELPQTATVTDSFGWLEPGPDRLVMAPIPDDIAPFDCEIVSLTTTLSPSQG